MRALRHPASLRVRLLTQVASGDAMADMLAMHRRTLNRRLHAAGTTFRNAWGGPYFADVFGLPAGSRGLALAVLSGMGVLALSLVLFKW